LGQKCQTLFTFVKVCEYVLHSPSVVMMPVCDYNVLYGRLVLLQSLAQIDNILRYRALACIN